MIRRRSPKLLVALGLTLTAIVTAAVQMDEPPLIDSEVLGKKVDKGPVIDASCDVDGVGVSYDASYTSIPASNAGFHVARATVTDVSSTCMGADVTVELTGRGQLLAMGTSDDVTATPVLVSFDAAPPAHQVDGVHVEIAGGTTPIPEECFARSMTFDRFQSLTQAANHHPGSKDRDLLYGREGNDTLRGDNQHDCLVGQAGNDQLVGDNHDDVLIGGAGDDTLDGGNNDDLLVGGAGADTFKGGAGRDECRGDAADTYISCEVRP